MNKIINKNRYSKIDSSKKRLFLKKMILNPISMLFIGLILGIISRLLDIYILKT